MVASAYHVISKEVENRIMDTIAFLDTQVFVNNPYFPLSYVIFVAFFVYSLPFPYFLSGFNVENKYFGSRKWFGGRLTPLPPHCLRSCYISFRSIEGMARNITQRLMARA